MKISLRQIEGFLAVADTLSFTRAADRLGMTQPAFSQLIRELEASLGVSLLDRTTRRVRVSAAGTSLLEGMRRGVDEIEGACHHARAMARLEQGVLEIAVLPSLVGGMVLQALSIFRERHPGLSIRLWEDHNTQILGKLAEYDVELAIGSQMDSSYEFVFEELMVDELVCVLPEAHKLARQERVEWRQLAHEPIILVSASSQTYQVICSNLLQYAQAKQAEYQTLNAVTALGMARAGFGLSFIRLVTLAELNMSGLTFRRMGDPRLLRSIGIYRRVNHALSPGAASFCRILREHVPAAAT